MLILVPSCALFVALGSSALPSELRLADWRSLSDTDRLALPLHSSSARVGFTLESASV